VKKRLDIRIAEELRDGIDLVASRDGHTLTTVVERYIEKGLARDNGELIEQSSLPAIRAAVREEVAKAMTELYQQLSADLQKSAKRSDDRLAALIIKAARSAGIAQRMLLSLAGKVLGQDAAMRAYEDAREKAGKDIAKPEG
jgi:outer membrane PBP1 activator LpoA protein